MSRFNPALPGGVEVYRPCTQEEQTLWWKRKPMKTEQELQYQRTMPTYEYECQDGHRFEIRQGIDDEPLQHCQQEDCQEAVERQIGMGAGVIFKGPGFYETDYRQSRRDDQKGRSR